MAWVVDSCVLLDIGTKNPKWGIACAQSLEDHFADGLTVCPISVIEIAPNFPGGIDEVRHFLFLLGIEDNHPWLHADTRAAAGAWSAYVNAKRAGRIDKRPLADLLIGAFAHRVGGLITRNPDDFRPWFPGLAICQPAEPK